MKKDPVKGELAREPFYKKRSFWIASVAALLVLAILVGALVYVLGLAPAVYEYDGVTLREDDFAYLFACFKHLYQVHYKSLKIEDTPEGWLVTDESGRSYEEIFHEMITEEILLRFVAATIFDAEGYVLSDADYDRIEAVLDELDTETFGEVPLDALSEQYGVGRRVVKQTAPYERKYAALRDRLFADRGAIYGMDYREDLKTFYQQNYYRYNLIQVSDSVGSDKIAALEAQLWPMGNVGEASVTGITEELFTKLEAEYTTATGITSGNYPNGIYLYGGTSYSSAFSAELLSAFQSADEVGKVVKVRYADDTGSYYVMRYALDEEPYLSEDSKVQSCFKDLPDYAGQYLYRRMLYKELARVVSHGIAETYTVADTKRCEGYCNIVELLGN